MPRILRVLSERLIVSHHDCNHAGAVKNLNKVEEDLARVTSEIPSFIVAGIKERELTFTNAVILHESCFGSLGGGGQAGGRIAMDLGNALGTIACWKGAVRHRRWTVQ